MNKAPDFNLPDQDSEPKSLKNYAGRWLVLYFYPKDDTPGCTTEACNFRDEREAIGSLGNAEVVGISKDSPKSHKRFVEKYNLNFTLLSDEDASTAKAYGVWGPKKFMGREYIGMARSTFIINPDGYIVKEYPKVDPKKHAAEIINDLQELQSS
jgi:thioredoxin-dependent peroxiredoxin